MMKAGRNDPCPCGSGKKYKHCCQAKGSSGSSLPNVAQLLQAAAAQHNAGQPVLAEMSYRQVLQVQPNHPEALNQLGLIAYKTGHTDEAVQLIRQAIVANKRVPDFYNNLGNILFTLGRFAEAEVCLREMLTLGPSADAQNNLGSMLQKQGRVAEAVASYRQAVKLQADSPLMWNNLGFALQLQGDHDEAMRCYRRALKINPEYRDALLNLGNVLSDKGQYAEVIDIDQRLVQVDPKFAIAHSNLGHALQRQGRLAEALTSFKEAFTLQPDLTEAWQNYLFALNYAPGYSAQAIFEEHARFGKQFEDGVAGLRPQLSNVRDPGKRLKIGYVSADFRNHAVAYFIEPVLANHNREQVEVYCYYNENVPDAVTQRLKALVAHWRDISTLSDDVAAQQIRDDGIDMLIDLSGYSGGNRLGVFARKPAPVQASWLGYLCTTGLRSMDYRITDVSADPVGSSERYYTEKLIRLPDTFVCYRPIADGPVVDRLPALKKGYVTFGSFNNLAKVTPEVRALWARVLLAVPDSRLLLKTKGLGDSQLQQQLLEDFARHDVPADRLELVSWDDSYMQHLNYYNQVDIGLDPFPCNGGTTSFDAMWMGVPVVTLAGDRFIARMGVSMLTSLGMTELIAAKPEDYVEIVARLASDLDHLAVLRTGLRQRMAASPLTDAQRFTLNLERAYREMWFHWCDPAQDAAGTRRAR